MKHLDPALLRSFVAFAETGTLARTAEVVGRTPSAVTAQMQRLEATIGVKLLRDAGRGRVLTETGERLLGHARRLLAAERDALLDLVGAEAEGTLTLGLTQDFANPALSDLLRLFAESHPRVRLDLRIGRTATLVPDFETGKIDLLLGMRMGLTGDEVATWQEPICWLAAKASPPFLADQMVPLAVLDPPCGFRNAAIEALEQAGSPYRLAVSSPSLAGLAVGVQSGLAITARTARWQQAGIEPLPDQQGLPTLPKAEFSLRLRGDAAPASQRLADLLRDDLQTFSS